MTHLHHTRRTSPAPSGMSRRRCYAVCINDPGDGAKVDPDSYRNQIYTKSCYTLQFMPAVTSYLDTPVVPIFGCFAGPEARIPLDCEYPDGTPVYLSSVSVGGGIHPGCRRSDQANNTECPNAGTESTITICRGLRDRSGIPPTVTPRQVNPDIQPKRRYDQQDVITADFSFGSDRRRPRCTVWIGDLELDIFHPGVMRHHPDRKKGKMPFLPAGHQHYEPFGALAVPA